MKRKLRQKHNYTSEIELKCLLIRVKNKKLNKEYSTKLNNKINRYVKLYNKINDKKYPQELIKKKNSVKSKIKNKLIIWSENTNIDDDSYERFGNIILLMIKRILTKPQFSGYTYKDDFYSDAIHKILKYLHNFDHTIISIRSNTYVNSFAYISQIIHNSVLYVLNYKKKELANIQNQISMEIIGHNFDIKNYKEIKESRYNNNDYTEHIEHMSHVTPNKLIEQIKKLADRTEDRIVLNIPEDYKLSMEEYDKLKPFLNGKFCIIREKIND